MAPLLKLTNNFVIGHDQKTYIIAEIGQNHQGNLDEAKKLIIAAKENGADCVKFQKSHLPSKFTRRALERPYLSENSFGSTYGEHKTFLEFSTAQFSELLAYAAHAGVAMTSSAMDPTSLRQLAELNLPFIKIGSGDTDNFKMIEDAAKMNVPLVISTGMQDFKTVKLVYDLVSKYHKNFALMHCISTYPAPIEDINLNVLKMFKAEFPDIVIGYSGHELGTDISVAATVLGAQIIERHITLDKDQKGTDHKCSLTPQEFGEMVTKIRTIEKGMGGGVKRILESELDCKRKLGKCLVASKELKAGVRLTYEDIEVKVAEPRGIEAAELYNVIGQVLLEDVAEDEPILRRYVDC